MRTKLTLVLMASALGACAQAGERPEARGLSSINEPVLSRATFAYDLAAPGGVLPPSELARLDGWFRTLSLGYGDSIYVDGAYAETVRQQVQQVAGNYGMIVLPAAPVTAGAVSPGSARVVVARMRAEVPGCANWDIQSQPNYNNATMSNFGCSVNGNLAAMVANPEDLFRGRDASGLNDAQTAIKAVEYYRQSTPTGTQGLQDIKTKKDK